MAIGRSGRVASLALFVGVVLCASFEAFGQREHGQFAMEKAQRAMALVPGNEAIEAELFPAVAGMDACPVPHRTRESLRYVGLIDPGTPLWRRAMPWVEADAQQAALEALAQVADPDNRFMLSLPLGRELVDESWVEAGLFVELGPDGMLTPLDPVYLRTLHSLHALAVLDAKRLAGEGDGAGALGRMVDLIWLYRRVRDRPTVEEQLESTELMAIAAEQLRDLVFYFDGRGAFTADELSEAVEAIGEPALRLERVRFPTVPRFAGEQMIGLERGGEILRGRLYVPEGQVIGDRFAEFMAEAEAGGDAGSPLELFGARARYRALASQQVDWFDAEESLGDVMGNYEQRWAWDINDEDHLTVPSTHDRLNKPIYRVVDIAAEGLDLLVPYRRAIMVHLSGTRIAMAAVAYRLDFRRNPRSLLDLQPRYVSDIDTNLDLFGYDFEARRSPDLLYFVPQSASAVPPGTPRRFRDQYLQPHPVRVVYPGVADLLLGAKPWGVFDFTELVIDASPERLIGMERAEFPIEWFARDDDGARLADDLEGSPPPPLTFVTPQVEAFDVRERPGEILLVIPAGVDGAGTEGGFVSPENIELFSQIGREYHYDGVRVVVIAGNYAGTQRSAAELRILAARLARQVGVFDIAVYSEVSGLDGAWTGFDTEEPVAFLVDRTGVVRASGLRYRHMKDAIEELLDEQPASVLLYDEAEIESSAEARLAPFPVVFRTEVTEDEFVLYSRGVNTLDDRSFGSDHVFDFTGRELLFWPPVLSLQRDAGGGGGVGGGGFGGFGVGGE